MNIAVFGPHPDDQELGMGGTIARLAAEGHAVTLVDLSDGEPTPMGNPHTRAKEAAEAASILGVPRLALGLRNRAITDDLASRAVVAGAIRSLRADIVFAPHPIDAHPDHVAATNLIEAACFAAKFTKSDLPGEPHTVRHIFHYFATHLRAVPQPAFIVDTTGFAERKQRAILAYASQFVHNEQNRKIPEWVHAAGTYFGSRIGCESGEPFGSRQCIALDVGALRV
ncbi:MAG: bacillithiol biosynthesis deacetylase BshB1 [Phycisphaerae bacterium]|nr:bacillithiol biosynthesis deacetylase BshB1 [Phycisphaerae bacterium]